MEDKELQELFDAKRTTEANRRRQEELRRLIEAEAAPKSRRLWPIWTGSIAAGLALLLLTLSALFNQEGPTPVQMAQVETALENNGAPGDSGTPGTPGDSGKTGTSGMSGKTKATPAITTIVFPVQEATPLVEQPAPEPAIQPAEESTVQPATPAPRVMRRTSTLIACTEGCTLPEGTNERKDRNIEVTFFAENANTNNIIYSFEINK